MEASEAFGAVEQIRAGIDALLACDLTPLSGADVSALVAGLEVQRRRCDAVDQRVLAELGERGLAGEYGCTTPIDLLVELLRVSPREAKARLSRSRDLGPRRTVSGERLQPLFAVAASAAAQGRISAAHVSVITRYVSRIPPVLAFEFAGLVENALVGLSEHLPPHQVAKDAEVLLAHIDPDGAEPREAEQQRRRDFGLRSLPDGSSVPAGRFTPQLTASLRTILDALSAPLPAEDGTRDDRTPGQRRHDALLEACQRILRSGSLPDSGGVPTTITLRAELAQLTSPEAGGYATTAHGELLPIGSLLQMAANEAETVLVTFDAAGGVLSYGRTRRLASCGQRLVLAERDRGCSFPGCTRPPAWCEAHHVVPWWAGGRTDVSNLTLLCGYHHREFEKRGWTVRMNRGHPEWTPPKWLDPEQRARRNAAHHLPEIDFGMSLVG